MPVIHNIGYREISVDHAPAVDIHKNICELAAYAKNFFLRKNVMLTEKKMAQRVSGHIFQHKKIALPHIDHAQKLRYGRVVEAGEDDSLVGVGGTVSAKQVTAEALQDDLPTLSIRGEEADAVAPASQPLLNGVVSDLSPGDHLFIGVPQSGQNFAPGGTGLPQPGQKEAVAIFAPQERQNLEPAGTEVPQLGQTLCPCGEACWFGPLC